MSKRNVSLLASCVAVVIASVAAAGTTAPAAAKAETATVNGTVISFSDSSLVIRTGEKARMTFAIASKSTIPAGLKEGKRVDVTYDTLADGSYRASKIDVFEPETSSKPKSRASAAPVAGGGARPSMALVGVLSLSAASGAWLISQRATA